MITVHHLENSRSQRVLWLLEELELPYQVKRYERDKKTSLAPPELTAIHPLGKSPVIVDAQARVGSQTVAETGAIVEYLVEKAGGKLGPSNTVDKAQYTYWLHFAEGSAMPNLVMTLIFNKIKRAPMPFFAKPIAKAIANNVLHSFIEPNIQNQLRFMNDVLGKQPYFAGPSFSAADIMMSFPLEAAAARAGLGSNYPNLQQFLERIQERPAFKTALERGYSLLT
jgi:glutathione S-transferase